MKIGYVQTSPEFGNKALNLEAVEKIIGETKTDLLVLPELFAAGYAFTSKEEVAALAEDIDGETASCLKRLSTKTGAAIVAGFVERADGEIYNSAMLVHAGSVVDTYRKIHLFNKEKLWFTPGDKRLKTYVLNGARIGVMVCFDWIFPEVTRTLALQGAQIIAHPCNLVLPYCQRAMVTRCLENRVFAVTANRIGREVRGDDDFTFTGGSQITSTNGDILASASTVETSLVVIEIDPTKADNKSVTGYNDVLGDRRPEFYLQA